LIETSSDSGGDSDEQGQLNIIKMMDNKNPLIRLSVFGRIKRMLNTYKNGDNMDIVDKRLVRGLYLRNLKDFDDNLQLQQSKITLY